MHKSALVLALALLTGFAPHSALAQVRWTAKAPGAPGIRGLQRAAEARGCTVRHRLPGAVSFDCPDRVSLGRGYRRATRMVATDTTTNALINADAVHAANPFGGPFDGAGVVVAVVDSGLDTDHPDIAGAIIGCTNTTGDTNACEDIDGHGTAVAGVITGDGANCGAPTGDCSIGTAPGASIVGVKVFPDNGAAIYDDDLAVAIDEASSFAPDVMNISIGGGTTDATDCDGDGDLSVDAVNRAFAAGIAVAISSGNEKYKDGIGYPACASGALAVGATYQRNEGTIGWSGCRDRNTVTDQVTCFSNVGPALDVVAPGAFLWAAAVGGGYGWFHGTSAASPAAAGALAIAVEQGGGALTPAQSYEALIETALELGSNKNQARNGNGRIDSFDAAAYVDANFGGCAVDADCDDANPCTDDSCDAGAATCVNAPNAAACDDGDLCTSDDVCSAGFCSGQGIDCDDADACTDDTCDPGTGQCRNDAADCSDGVACTVDSCEAGSGLCLHDDSACPQCLPLGASCTANDECCGNRCKGKSGRKTCK